MDLVYDGQNVYVACANGDFPLVVLLWGMASAKSPTYPEGVDLLALEDSDGNSLVHFAAASDADPVDIMHFLMQQMQATARLDKLINAKNHAGETPLMRAANAGNLRVVAALVRIGHARINEQDANGNTAMHHAAAQGHLLVLHYLLYTAKQATISSAPAVSTSPSTSMVDVVVQTQPGPEQTDAVRGGLDHRQRTVLHYACEAGHERVVAYLLREGFDPSAQDAENHTCHDIAAQNHNTALVSLLKNGANLNPTTRNTRVAVLLAYAIPLAVVFSTSYFLKWYIALPLILVLLTVALRSFSANRHGHGHGHNHGAQDKSNLHPSKRNNQVAPSVSLAHPHIHQHGDSQCSTKKKKKKTLWSRLMTPQPEVAIGVWTAFVLFFTLFLVVVFLDSKYRHTRNANQVLLYIAIGFESLLLLVWLRLAILCPTDPGQVVSFEKDLETFLVDAQNGFPLNTVMDCRTCFVKKPIRSKHCAQCRVCFARFDHHCVWINRCVGWNNHGLFLVFLLVHFVAVALYFALAIIVTYNDFQESHSASDVWMHIPSFFSNNLFVLLVMLWCIFTLGAQFTMLWQHFHNISKNLTINESINWQRYNYLNNPKEPTSDPKKRFKNPFDRGFVANWLEFLQIGKKYHVDYDKLYHIPVYENADAVPLNSDIQQV